MTLLEVSISLAIAALTFYGGMQLHSATVGAQSRLVSQEAIDQIRAEVATVAMQTAYQYMISRASDPASPCGTSLAGQQFQSFFQNPTLPSGLQLQLLDEETARSYSTNPNNQPYSDSLTRCTKTVSTVYPTSAVPDTTFGTDTGLYFCAVLSSPSNKSNSSIAYMTPVLMEFLFEPFDVGREAQLTCNSLNTAGTSGNPVSSPCTNSSPFWPSTVMGMLFYTVHWSSVGPGGVAIANHYHGYLASGCPAG